MSARAATLLLVAVGCAAPGDRVSHPTPPGSDLSVPPPVEAGPDDTALLTRISLDLRGVRPTIEELDEVEAHPLTGPDGSLDAIVDRWLRDPRFGDRLMDLYDDVYSSRNGNYYVHYEFLAGQLGMTHQALIGHIAEEPLRMIRWVAEHDEPVETLVRADWTLADEVLAEFYPIDYPAGETGWRQVHYTDDRPPVGVLAMTSVWTLHGSMENNRNRNRANFVARALLCEDFLEHEVPPPTTQLAGTVTGLEDAIKTDPSCVSCHATLDPLASHFYGYWWYDLAFIAPDVYAWYHPEREELWRDITGVPPGYFGQPSRGLIDLGELVAHDPRFASCAVEQAWELMTRTDVDLVPVDLSAERDAFAASGHRLRELYHAIAADPVYQGRDPRFRRKRVTPSVLSSQIADLTTVWWESPESGRELLESPEGYTLLAGGFDRDMVLNAAPTETVTSVLVEQRLAETAARFVVEHDAASPDRILLADIDFTERPDGPGRERMVAQLQHLHRRILGRRVAMDAPEVEHDLQVWEAAMTTSGDPSLAWATVLTLLFLDPDFVTY
ncbi:MAG: DUF1549 domain-containing protein [Alphaproteobacteria bacterium]|nr:DUF1549 domain-containing protein [Alphaproteobacteria bacterium]